jgi:hypothetical protein
MNDYAAAAASSEQHQKSLLKTRRRSQVVDTITALIGLALLFSGGLRLPLLGAVLMLYGLIGFRLAAMDSCLAFIQDEINLLEVKVDRMEVKIDLLLSVPRL